jgi:carboxyl-terminal processing protease
MNSGNKKIKIYLPVLLALVLAAGILVGLKLNRQQGDNRFLIYPRTDKLTTVLNYIEQEYVDTVDRKQLVDDAIPAMLKDLDPHSLYIPAKDLEEVNEPLEGNFSGIGVQFNMQDDTVAIINTIPNGPSELVGIKPGDRIIRVNDSVVAGVNMPSEDIVKMLKGERGTKVNVTIARRGESKPLEFEIVRDEIPLYSVDVAYMVAPEIGYIKINSFGRTTLQEFQKGVQKLHAKNMNKLIVDLRGNGGGYMDAATNIADQFLKGGKLIVYTKGRSKPRTDVYATDQGSCQQDELIILIDEGSASASEILAGAIQDNDRGLIMGRRSFGKGLVQEQIMLNDGSAIRLTIARYYTPTGRCIQKSYAQGNKEYYMDLHERFEHGELVEADSIHFADSLKYTTPGGNTVYGGGGIMPDIFVPLDTVGLSDYFTKIRSRGLIYRFAFDYTDQHRQELNQFTNIEDLRKYLQNKDLMNEFTKFAKDKGVPVDREGLKISGNIIHTQLEAYIARNILDNEGFYPIIKDLDNTLLKAVKIMQEDRDAPLSLNTTEKDVIPGKTR